MDKEVFMNKGRVTIPTDSSFVEGTKRIARLWGADAVRDCDGVSLPDNAKEIAGKVYKTYFVVRGDNSWARKHPEEAPRMFLESSRHTANSSFMSIDPMEGYLKDQFDPDYNNISLWQVYDRTTNKKVESFKINNGRVEFETTPYHEYSVDFYVRITWHPVQIYNYLTNNWTCEKQLAYDPAYPNTKEYVKQYLQNWLDENKDIDVVRFTTFLYQFTLAFNSNGKEKMVNWFGYGLAASTPLLEGFKKETGLEMEAEDFISNGQYDSTFKLPSEKWKKYTDYVGRFVTSTLKELVDIVHKNNREAMMFLGDDWIGSEPYGPYFKNMGLDSVVGSIGGGVTVRMLSEIPYVKVHEGRFLPYFFPDTFYPGNEDNAIKELETGWSKARRAMLRSPLERMGFGGYLSLADKFPRFIDKVTSLCDEFRNIYENCHKDKPYNVLKVALLNSFGKIRSYQSFMVAHELWYQQIYSYQGILEILSGLPVDIEFISFDEVIANGVNKDIDVLILAGDEGTSFSGGEYWSNLTLVENIRKYVANGGGIIGVGEPSALTRNGRCFVLSDVFGVEEEKGFTLSIDKYNIEKKLHFITDGIHLPIDFGEGKKNIYALDGTDVLDITFSPRFKRNVNVGEVNMASNSYFDGRSFYITGIPYSKENSRLLYKALLWVAKKEEELNKAYSSNLNSEVSYYPTSKKYALINNSSKNIKTTFFDINGNSKEIELEPNQLMWIEE